LFAVGEWRPDQRPSRSAQLARHRERMCREYRDLREGHTPVEPSEAETRLSRASAGALDRGGDGKAARSCDLRSD
jgi:hypothetical protein